MMKCVQLIIVLVFLGLICDANELCKQKGIRGWGVDIKGSPVKSKSPDDCINRCIKNNACLSMTYNEKKKDCWLKSAIKTVRWKPQADWTSWTKNCAACKQKGIRGWGADIKGSPVKSPSSSDCINRCVKNNACVSMTYNMKKKDCWLKSSIKTVRWKPQASWTSWTKNCADLRG